MKIECGAQRIGKAWSPVIWATDINGKRVLWSNEAVKCDDRTDAAVFAIDQLEELMESGRLRVVLKNPKIY